MNSPSSTKYKINLNLNDNNDARILGFNLIEPNRTVLDVGAACGDFGVLLKNEKKNILYGFEYNLESVEIALKTKTYEDIDIVDLNIFNPSAFSEYYEKFDYIVILDVLEHLIDPQGVLIKLKSFLKKTGYFIISIPNLAHCSIKANLFINDFTYTEMGLLDKTHIRFFTYKSIAELLSSSLLEVVEMKMTISELPANIKIPFVIKQYILSDANSYVNQYIVKARLSSLSKSLLQSKNISILDVKWKNIFVCLLKLKKQKIKESLFPNKRCK